MEKHSGISADVLSGISSSCLRSLVIAEEVCRARRPCLSFQLLCVKLDHVERDLKLLFGLYTDFLYFWRYGITVCYCCTTVFRLRTHWIACFRAASNRLADWPSDRTEGLSEKLTIYRCPRKLAAFSNQRLDTF